MSINYRTPVKCAGCHRNLPHNIRHCPHCGTRLPLPIPTNLPPTSQLKPHTPPSSPWRLWLGYGFALFLLASLSFGFLVLLFGL